MANLADSDYKITLYTYYGCPYAHRVHIALEELGLQFDKVHIDLDKPREPWYLKVNPRGLVPAMRISSPILGPNEHTLIESGIIVQFLADLLPARRLAPPSNSPAGAMARARLNFFIDTWNTKVGSFMFSLFKATTAEERESFSREWVGAVRREIEPLLGDAAPYFAGSARLTLAEVNVAPFIMRIYALADAEILPKSVSEGLATLPHFSRWADALRGEGSVLSVWNAHKFTERSRERLERMKAMKDANHAAMKEAKQQ